MKKTQLLPQAEQMFIRQGKGINEIAGILGIAASTVSRWAKKRDWEERRVEVQNSTLYISEKLLKLLATDVMGLNTLDNSSIDRITKAVKSIKSLNTQVDILGNTITVMEQLGNFLSVKHAKLFGAFQEVLPEFLVYMREKYKE